MNIIKKTSKEAFFFVRELYCNRRIILELTKRDFKIRYSENYLGFAWAVLEPLAMLLILWFVFTYLRHRAGHSYPFVAFLLSGLMAFNYFSSAVNSATKSIKSFSFILKRGSLNIALLPIVSIFSSLFINLISMVVAIPIFLVSGIMPSWYWLQLIYFIFCTSLLITGISWLTASIVLFVVDVQYIISIAMRVLFFLTPIFWEITMFPPKIGALLKMNPLYYLVDGYRCCLLYHLPFWNDPVSAISFWIFTIFFLILGMFVFTRLRPHFADVL